MVTAGGEGTCLELPGRTATGTSPVMMTGSAALPGSFGPSGISGTYARENLPLSKKVSFTLIPPGVRCSVQHS